MGVDASCIDLRGRVGAGLQNVNHIIIVMQENHSFDNYFGALPYAPGSPYHAPRNANSGCSVNDPACVDGLSCMVDAAARCIASTPTTTITAARYSHFTTPAAAIAPDLNHSWFPTQQEANYANPNNTLGQSLNNGFGW